MRSTFFPLSFCRRSSSLFIVFHYFVHRRRRAYAFHIELAKMSSERKRKRNRREKDTRNTFYDNELFGWLLFKMCEQMYTPKLFTFSFFQHRHTRASPRSFARSLPSNTIQLSRRIASAIIQNQFCERQQFRNFTQKYFNCKAATATTATMTANEIESSFCMKIEKK